MYTNLKIISYEERQQLPESFNTAFNQCKNLVIDFYKRRITLMYNIITLDQNIENVKNLLNFCEIKINNIKSQGTPSAILQKYIDPLLEQNCGGISMEQVSVIHETIEKETGVLLGGFFVEYLKLVAQKAEYTAILEFNTLLQTIQRGLEQGVMPEKEKNEMESIVARMPEARRKELAMHIFTGDYFKKELWAAVCSSGEWQELKKSVSICSINNNNEIVYANAFLSTIDAFFQDFMGVSFSFQHRISDKIKVKIKTARSIINGTRNTYSSEELLNGLAGIMKELLSAEYKNFLEFIDALTLYIARTHS